MTLTLEQALERIAELEALLEHAVYVKPEEWMKVASLYPLSPSEARIVVGLFKAGDAGLSHVELDALLPLDSGKAHLRADPDFRTINVVKQFVWRIRQRASVLMQPSNYSHHPHVRLSEEGRRLVGEALGASCL